MKISNICQELPLLPSSIVPTIMANFTLNYSLYFSKYSMYFANEHRLCDYVISCDRAKVCVSIPRAGTIQLTTDMIRIMIQAM